MPNQALELLKRVQQSEEAKGIFPTVYYNLLAELVGQTDYHRRSLDYLGSVQAELEVNVMTELERQHEQR